ncbi:19280_t:CDS:2 [Funneliformis geosporum]|uniref:19280_t:CDS:1 n=1 Tax=Funneliformis geosporum TaxID=1117311 RepID=A0A9W4SFD9_9GLOM|nr:19280_t:CDS:2 [Funneliformis geosporum]
MGIYMLDIHSGNILFFDNYLNGYQWQIGDLGLSQPANNTSSNDGIFGVMPYIAPEVLNGGSVSKASDIYTEIKRLELMKHCPEIAVMHPNAVFTSRNSSSLFSRSSPIMNSLYINQGYVSKEYDFDIPSPPTINTDSTMINSSRKRNIKELKAKYSS